jgi:predicted ATPase
MVTLVFTDIEGSTRLLAELGQVRYFEALSEHRQIMRNAFGRFGGYEVNTQGDSFFYAFSSASGAVKAVKEAMAALEGGPVAVRAGVHTGAPGIDGPDYYGLDVHTAARIMAAGHGGQVLLSQTTRELLDDSFVLSDLGDHRLKDLSEPRRLYQLGVLRFPALRTLYRTNLPVPATAFVGRGVEVDELATVLRDGVRLVTLMGPGGVGKTRLALQAVGEAADAFPDGVWWVPLASLRDPALVLSSVALAIGVPEQRGRTLEETLGDVLSDGRALLLLDNLEQLLPDAAASLAALRDAGGATVVVTSRERLGLAGERVYAVAPLAPAEALELFADRTAALGVDAGDVAAVGELCSRLDNLPLAVELAAARTALLAPAEILARLGGRLDRLKGGRDSDPRQQTLRDTITWSHDLLDEHERELFAHLAIFAGGGTIDAVDVVCDGDLDVLGSLLDKSLVRRTGDRVWMLETIHEFAIEQLEENSSAEDVHDRHADYYLTLAAAADRDLRSPHQRTVLERLDAERENLRAAFDRLLDRNPPAALELVAALWSAWYRRGHFHEGQEMALAALDRADPEPTAARAEVLAAAGTFASVHGEPQKSVRWFQEALACARSAASVRGQIRALGSLQFEGQLNHKERVRLGQEAILLARTYPDRWFLGVAIGQHGVLMDQLGDTERAVDLYEEACRIFRDVGDASFTAIYLSNHAEIALRAWMTGEARARLVEGLELARGVDSPVVVALITVNLGWATLQDGDADGARSRFLEAADIARRLGQRIVCAEAMWGLAHVAAHEGDPLRVARLAGCASALYPSSQEHPTITVDYFDDVDNARAAATDDAWQKAWAEGAELNLDDGLSLALGESPSFD